MNSSSIITRVAVGAIGVVGALALLAGPADAAGGRHYDTSSDGKPDVTVIGLDTNGDRVKDTVLIDTNNNGEADPGEPQVQCPQGQQPRVKATLGNNGLRIEVFCGKGKTPFRAFVVQDQNGDGDTADAGEVRPG